MYVGLTAFFSFDFVDFEVSEGDKHSIGILQPDCARKESNLLPSEGDGRGRVGGGEEDIERAIRNVQASKEN